MVMAAGFDLARALAAAATDRERKGPQPDRRDLCPAVHATPVIIGVQAFQRLVDLRQGLAPHLEERKLELSLDVRLRLLRLVLNFPVVDGALGTSLTPREAKVLEDLTALGLEKPP